MLENNCYSFWNEKLGSPRFILAPMVDHSELAWRLLSRKYGAQLCYTPMLHASVFIKDHRYRKENLASSPEDRPLIVQFCANDADTFVEACKLCVGHCEAVDLNIGCPQAIARRGHYGSFLQEEWELLANMVSRASKEAKIPITCKIRVFKDVERTIKYAQMLEKAGCQLLTVHGRTREQKGPLTGLASWEHIKAVKQNLRIPIFANGNIQYLSDVHRCLIETGVDGVMIAEGSLHNPALFRGLAPTVWEMALEYLELVKLYPCPTSYVRGHLFKLCHHCLLLDENKNIRQKVAVANCIEEFRIAVIELKDKYENFLKNSENHTNCLKDYGLPDPPWICQPYVRPDPVASAQKVKKEKSAPENEIAPCGIKRQNCDNSLSKKKLKKLLKNPRKQFSIKKAFDVCSLCPNPKGTKCTYQLCKSCCRDKSFKENLDCSGHRFSFKTKMEKSDQEAHCKLPKEFDVQSANCDNFKDDCL
nr:tRNA-dihydrouridine(16/17) synthase [NAD(P)(+)]-like [Parasteatoda tepidariorum]